MPWSSWDSLNSTNLNAKSGLVYNIKDATYGAVGDGVTDDTSAIQKAFHAAGATGGLVYIPEGTCMVSGLTIPANNITIEGDGPQISILSLTSGGNATVISATSMSNLHFHNFGIDGSKSVNTVAKDGIRLLGCNNVWHDTVFAKNCEQDGFYVSGCSDIKYIGCRSETNKRNGYSCGDTVNGSQRITYLGCSSNGHHTAVSDIGFALEPTKYSVVMGCQSEGDSDGITILGGTNDSSDYNVVSGNQINDFRRDGITNQPGVAGSSHNIIADNVLVPNIAATVGFSLTGVADVSVLGNRCSAMSALGASYGLFADTSLARFVISNNEFDGAGYYGILLSGASNGVISNNVIRNASQAGAGLRDGMRLSSCTDVQVLGNRIYDSLASKMQGYSLNLQNASDRITIIGNNLDASITGALSLVGNSNIVLGNYGHTTDSISTLEVTSLVSTAAIRLGSLAAATGSVRLPNAGEVIGRNSGNTADVNMLRVSSANNVQVGGSNVGEVQLVVGSDVVRMLASGHLRPNADSSQDLGVSGGAWRTMYGDTFHSTTTTPFSVTSSADFNDMAAGDLRLAFTASGLSLCWSSGDSLYDLNGSATSAVQPTS